jgi:glycosyltransferase involved in cell wall biosynthesis
VGDGPDEAKVRAAAGANVLLAGRLPRESLRELLRRARAFVFAAEEDFGIAPVEALACGTPVIAYARGGVTETVTWGPGGTGVVFEEQSEEAIAGAVRRFESLAEPIPAERCRERALLFGADRFRREFAGFVTREWERFAWA